MRPNAPSGLTRTYLSLRLHTVTAFRGPFFIELFWGAAYMATMFIFWEVIFAEVTIIKGWTHGAMLLFMYFLELFWGISRSLLAVTRYFWTLINRGSIDVFLCRPVNVRLAMLLHGSELTVLGRSMEALGNVGGGIVAAGHLLLLAQAALACLQIIVPCLLGGGGRRIDEPQARGLVLMAGQQSEGIGSFIEGDLVAAAVTKALDEDTWQGIDALEQNDFHLTSPRRAGGPGSARA